MTQNSSPAANQHPTRTADEYLEFFRTDRFHAPLALYTGAALHKAGRLEEALAVWTLGDDVNSALRTIQFHPEADEIMRQHSALADRAIRDHFIGLHNSVIDRAEEKSGETLPRLRNAIWTHYHKSAFDYKTALQRPLVLYMPDLPAYPVADNSELPWVNGLSEMAPTIIDEYKSAVAANVAGSPYVHTEMKDEQWTALRDKMDWSAIYLYLNAQETDDTHRFPKTLAALEDIDLVKKSGLPLEAFFSVLKPGTHIPPHFGLTNTRLTVHLPLILPDQCAIRVGENTYEWQIGVPLAFDDSFEHEAWNKSDETRVVMIFEIPHPDLSTLEQQTIEEIYATFDGWVAAREKVAGMPALDNEQT